MSASQNRQKAAVALFMAVLTLVGLFTVSDYTGSYDEIAEQNILAANMKEYALYLSKVGIQWEAWLCSEVAPISQSVEKDHGISAYYLYGLLFPWLEQAEGLRYTLWSVMTWLWFMLGVWSLYALSRKLGACRKTACLGALTLYLSPRFFADAHLNNKDMVLLSLFLAVLWLGTRLLEKPTLGRALLFSLLGAMAANTKIVGAMPWGLMWLAFGLRYALKRRWNVGSVGVWIGTAVTFLLFYIGLTPAVWEDPTGFFPYLLKNATAFSRWSGRIFFRNASFELPENPLPFYYLIYMMIVTLPVYTLPLAAAGQLRAVRELVRKPKVFLSSVKGLLLTAASLCWMIPVAAFALLKPLVYNGWRHFYFTYAGLAVMVVYGVQSLLEKRIRRVWLPKVYAICLCVCLALTAVGMTVNHPRQAAYYNVLAGDDEMETDYWNTAGTYALKKLLSCEKRNVELPLEVGCWFFDIQNARFKLSAEEKARLTTTTEADAPYLYYIENYVQVYDVPEPENYHVLFEVESYGRLIGTMYERDY